MEASWYSCTVHCVAVTVVTYYLHTLCWLYCCSTWHKYTRLPTHAITTALLPKLVYCSVLLCLIAALPKCYFTAEACVTLLLHLSWYYYVSLLWLFMPCYHFITVLYGILALSYTYIECINPFALAWHCTDLSKPPRACPGAGPLWWSLMLWIFHYPNNSVQLYFTAIALQVWDAWWLALTAWRL